MSQTLYVIIDENSNIARKISGGHNNLGVFVSKAHAKANLWRYIPRNNTEDYKIVEYENANNKEKED